MSRIYQVKWKQHTGVVRYVRTSNLNAAIRAVAHEMFEARPASAEDIYAASREVGGVEVMDATADDPADVLDVPAHVAETNGGNHPWPSAGNGPLGRPTSRMPT